MERPGNSNSIFTVTTFQKSENEQKRFNGYKKRIRKIHDDGCIEYKNNKIAYFLAEAGNRHDNGTYGIEAVTKLLNNISARYAVNIYIQNESEAAYLKGRYAGIELKGDKQADKFLTDLIYYNIRCLKGKLLYTPLVYEIKAEHSELKIMKSNIELYIRDAWKDIYPILEIADRTMVEHLLHINTEADKKPQEAQQPRCDDCEYDAIERGFMVHLE